MWIKKYILTIATAVLFSVLAESLMPETKMKKHISLVAGIIILLVIAKPVLSVAFDFEERIKFGFEETEMTVSSEISDKLERAQNSQIQSGFMEKLSESIEEDIEKRLSVKCKINAVLNNDNIICVHANTSQNDNIRKLIEETYGFKCKFEKGG